MKFSVAALVAAGAATVSAQQQEVYQIQALSPSSGAHLVGAVEGKIQLGGPSHAVCQGPSTGFAHFYAEHGGLFLYTPEGQTQQVYADMTPKGQGQLRYTLPSESLGPDMAAGGWSLSVDRGVTWNGRPLFACPSDGGPGTTWNLYVVVPDLSGCGPVITAGLPEPIAAPRCLYP